MAYRRNDSGCGCLIAIFVVVAIISGVRSCTEHLIDGDIKLPKLGSSRVSGGSGGSGTSNGYNVKYKQTTSPNYNSSLRDYTHTNSQPTKYEDNSSNQSFSNETSQSQSEVSSYTSTQPSIQKQIDEIVSEYEKQFTTCPICHGSGNIIRSWTFTGESGNPCVICWKSEKHEHINEPQMCYRCMGRGKVRVNEGN